MFSLVYCEIDLKRRRIHKSKNTIKNGKNSLNFLKFTLHCFLHIIYVQRSSFVYGPLCLHKNCTCSRSLDQFYIQVTLSNRSRLLGRTVVFARLITKQLKLSVFILTIPLNLSYDGGFIDLSYDEGGLKVPSLFLFVKTIEKVIRLCTVLIFFLLVVVKVGPYYDDFFAPNYLSISKIT